MLKEFCFVASGIKGLWDTEIKKCFLALQPGKMSVWADMSGATIMYEKCPFISLDDMAKFYCHEDDDGMEHACDSLLRRAEQGFFDNLPDAISEDASGSANQSCEAESKGSGEGS